MSVKEIRKELIKFKQLEKAKILCRFFKTGPGEYAEGDQFLGLRTDETRSVAKNFPDLPFLDIAELMNSKIHEERVVAVMILNRQFENANLEKKKEIYEFYLENIHGINNWDLVDGSAPRIVGEYLDLSKSKRDILHEFAKSDNLWKRRIAILATLHFIGKGEFTDSLKISEMLLSDKEDLIHKAVGWMLREIGKRDQTVLETFLKKNLKKLPRTTLRYAIERFPEAKRKAYLKG